jgi:hypothetical protein
MKTSSPPFFTAAFALLVLAAGAVSGVATARPGQEGTGDTAAHLRRARALRARARQDLVAAGAEYRAVLQRNPGQLDAERGLARVLRDQGMDEAALPYLQDVAARSGQGQDDARLGWALFRVGRWAEAADAFRAARRHGYDDAETARGAALAARAALDGDGGEAVRPPAVQQSGWKHAAFALFGTTAFIAGTVQRLLLWLIALAIAAGIAARAWGTLLGRGPSQNAAGLRLDRLRGLPVREIGTGRSVGRVRQILYDPELGRVAGFQTGTRWRWRVVALSATRGVGATGLIVMGADALARGDGAPQLGALALAGRLPLGPGRRRKRILSEDGALLGYTRPHHLWIDGATGDVTFVLTPSRFFEAWRVALVGLQFGPMDWLLGRILDWGFELLPGRLSALVRLPVHLVLAAGRDVVIVSAETAEWIERHFQELEAQAGARLEQVKTGVARARPALERARDSGAQLARRSMKGVAGGAAAPPASLEAQAPHPED